MRFCPYQSMRVYPPVQIFSCRLGESPCLAAVFSRAHAREPRRWLRTQAIGGALGTTRLDKPSSSLAKDVLPVLLLGKGKKTAKAKRSSSSGRARRDCSEKPRRLPSKQPPASPYTNSKRAAAYLGIFKAQFIRLRSRWYFKPSPITGRYHTDDLDRETRGLSARDAQGTCLSQQISTHVGTPPQAGFWPGAVPTSEAFK